MPVALARQRDVERRVGGRPHARSRLPLVLEVAEVVQLVLDDRSTDRGAVLLNADGDDAVRDRMPWRGMIAPGRNMYVPGESARSAFSVRPFTRAHIEPPFSVLSVPCPDT